MPKTILYIEDNEDNIEIVFHILQKDGHTVLIAKDGKQGLALAQEHQPDLILCDYHLPGLDGPEIVQAIRQMDDIKETLIIMLTADIYTRQASLTAGADDHLNKPIRRNQLRRTIEQLFQSRQ